MASHFERGSSLASRCAARVRGLVSRDARARSRARVARSARWVFRVSALARAPLSRYIGQISVNAACLLLRQAFKCIVTRIVDPILVNCFDFRWTKKVFTDVLQGLKISRDPSEHNTETIASRPRKTCGRLQAKMLLKTILALVERSQAEAVGALS